MRTTHVSEQNESDDAVNLRQLKEQLAGLKNRYTSRHPDVIRLENRIADLESKNKDTVPPIARFRRVPMQTVPPGLTRDNCMR